MRFCIHKDIHVANIDHDLKTRAYRCDKCGREVIRSDEWTDKPWYWPSVVIVFGIAIAYTIAVLVWPEAVMAFWQRVLASWGFSEP